MATINRQFQPSDFSSVTRGLECVLVYNGLELNDRLSADRYVITAIDGLADAEIRDSRETNPAQHGESAYDAYYGGRTITIEGYIKAGNEAKLEEMQQNLKRAFSTLTELPLKFQFFDVYETFDATADINKYTVEIGSDASVSPNGYITFSSILVQQWKRSFENKTYKNLRVASRVGLGSTNTGYLGLILREQDLQNYLVARIGDTDKLEIAEVINGTTNVLVTDTVSLNTDSDYDLIFMINENRLVAQVWDNTDGEDPSVDKYQITSVGESLYGECEYNLSATAFYSTYGESPGGTGLYMQASDNDWKVYSHIINAIYPGDFKIDCRKSAPITMREVQGSKKIQRDFMITLRASSPFFTSPVIVKDEMDVSVLSSYGRFYDRTYNILYQQALDGDQDPTYSTANSITVTNEGSFEASPIFRVNGPLTDPSINNSTTDQTMALSTTIADGDWVDIDLLNRTITDSEGNNVFAILDPSSDWISLAPGDNELFLSVTAFSGTPTLEVFWQHTWI